MENFKRFIAVVLCICLLTTLTPTVVLSVSAEDPWLWPVYNIYAMYRGYYSSHQGIDISAPLNTAVLATKSGTVIQSSNSCPHTNYGDNRCSCNGGCGNYVKLQHDDGTYSRYLHLSQGTAIAVNTHVNQGEIIGYSGSSGDSSGPHLHFDCYDTSGARFNNNPTDPRHTYISTHDAGNLSYIYDTTPRMWFENSNMTSNIIVGRDFTFNCTVCSNNGVKWYALVIYDSNNTAVQIEGEDVWKVASTNSYPVTNAAQRLDFASLSEGNYRLSVQCMDNDDNYYTIYEKDFAVAKPTMWFENSNMTGSILQGNGYSLELTVCGNNGVKWYAIVIYDSDNQAVQIEGEDVWKVASTNSYPVTNAAQRLNFATLSAGDYRLSVQCMDNDDNYFTIYEKDFVVSPPKMWCEHINMPDEITVGNSFSLAGNICGNNMVKWYAIVIYDCNNIDVQNESEAVWKITDTNSYPITNVAEMLDFSVLPVGNYRLSIQSMDKDDNYFGAYEKAFSVVAPRMWCEDINMPNEITVGNSFSLSGNICGNNLVKWYAIVIYDSNNIDVQNKAEAVWKVTDTNSYPITNVAAMLDFSVLPVGNYRLSIQSMDKDDNYFGAYEKEFSVKCNQHSYTEVVTAPTCVEQGYTTHTCKFCGDSYVDTYVPALKHDFGEWTQSKEPTCTEKGEEKRICSRCDAYETQEVAALGHDLIHHEAQAPTCAEIGWEAYDTCSRCDYTTYVEIKALDHDLIHHEEQKPNCTEIGWKAYDTCSRCDYSTYVEIEALGHDLIHHEAQAPTCTEIGWEAYDTCSRCDYSTYVEKVALDHDYKAVVTAPTCTEKGYTTYTCSRCGDSYVADEVAALDHTPGTAVEENRVDPTCTTNGGFDTVTYCTVCGEELSRIHTDLAALEHNWDDGVIDPTATCTTDGIKTFTCQRCGEKKTETIAAFGHTPGAAVEENRVDPTCTVNGGFDIVTYCSTCGAELSRIHTDLAALEHNWDDGVIDPAATCTTNGIKTFTCRRCAETKTETIAATGHTPGDSAKENEVAATCTTAGSYDIVIRCTICDEILYAEHYEIAALGHDWNDGEVTTPATATTDGVKTFTCKRCGAIRTEAIPATGEDACKHENTHPEHKDATCTEPGYDKMICNKCGAVVSEETIPALGHDLVADEAVAATCAETGLTAGEHCTRCDYKVAQETVPALGHDWNDGEVTTPATATTDGVKTFTCNRCGATKTETIPATGREDKPCDGGPSCPSYKFTDVKAGDWYHEAVDFAVKNGLFNGMSDTTFEPNIPMTRGMLVTVLWRYEGQPEGGTNNFADVKDGEWYAKAVAWAASKGIVNGVGNGKFDPNGKVTREQLAAILYRYSESKGFDTSKAGNLNTFPDAAKVSDWAKTAYSWAVGEGLIGGNVINGKTLLDPQGNATRAQVATILMRFIENISHAR